MSICTKGFPGWTSALGRVVSPAQFHGGLRNDRHPQKLKVDPFAAISWASLTEVQYPFVCTDLFEY